jgi:hypothetical protein
MSATVLDLFDRFLARVPTQTAGVLRAEEVARAEASEVLRAPFCSVLFKGQEAGRDEPLAVLVATAPSVAADSTALLDLAARKARAYKAPYFVTWTLRKACLWETPRPGTPAARDQLTKLRDYPEVFEVQAASVDLPEPARIAVLEGAKAIVKDLESLFRNQALDQVRIDATYFVRRLLDAVHRLLPWVTDSLHLRLDSDPAFREEMAVWAVKQGIAGDPRDVGFARSIARQIVYRLLGKVLFYQSLRRSARHLPDLDFRGADTSEVLPSLRRAFARALEIDYHAVFAEDLPDRVPWPADASRELAALIDDFHTRDFSHVPQDVIGTVFERLIPPEERHGLGQYFTPENLCDLVLAFCVRSPTDTVLDPTCGTGTFLIRAYDRLRAMGRHDHVALLSQLWGVDIAPFPAELATINLFRQHVAEHGNFPRILCRDFFSISPGQRFRFPPPKMDLDHPEMVEQEFPWFDAVVGNFPFIRQEKIEKLVPGYKAELEKVIADGWFDAYPDAFAFHSKRIERRFEQMRALNQPTAEYKAHAELRLSGKADMLAYLFFQAARFVRPGGRMGIITSNAWLDVDYGYELQRFLLNNFKLVAILESRCEPWFTEADVNTVVTIVERCMDATERERNLVKFVKVKRPLRQLIQGSPELETRKRLQHLSGITSRIESSGRKFRNVHPFGTLLDEDENFRVRVCSQEELRCEVESTGRTAKWGLLIRAPEVLFAITKEWADNSALPLIALEELIDVQSGIPTRINEFFYLTIEQAQERGIESCYLFPVVKSTRSSDRIKLTPDGLNTRVFLCNVEKETLRQKGHLGALSYIEWGETQRTADGTPWPEGPSVRNRNPGWWALGECQLTQICWTRFVGEKSFHLYSPVPVFADNALYVVNIKQKIQPELLAAILNSSLFALFQEAYGRTALGGGLLQVFLEDLKHITIPDPRRLRKPDVKKIKAIFAALANRAIEPVFAEVKRADRKAFDAGVLEAFGLDPKCLLGSLHAGLCELVRERSELGKTRGKERETRTRATRAENQVAEAVLDELLPEGPKSFPDHFFAPAAAAEERVSVPLPDAPLHFDSSPLLMAVHTEDESFTRRVRSPAEAKFMLYAQKAGHKVAAMPGKAVEISRTVANYEKYLRELRAQLEDTYYRRTLDRALAARLTQAAWERFRLPSVGT